MSLRRNRNNILSKITGSKKKPIFEWKIIDKVKYNDTEGVMREFRLIAKKNDKLSKAQISEKLQKKTKVNLFEMIFNATIILGPDNKRLLLDKIHPGSVFEKELAVGDYIKAIDGEILSSDKINEILKKIAIRKAFKIVALSPYKHDPEVTQEEIKITKQLDLLLHKDKLFTSCENEFEEIIFTLNLIVKNSDSEDFVTKFSFPSESNFLHKLKGSFLTISSLLKTSIGEPRISVLDYNGEKFYVSYTIRGDEKQTIFLGFNSNFTWKFDVRHHTLNVVRFLDYVYSDFNEIENFQHLSNICEILKIQLLQAGRDSLNFEKLFSCPSFVSLPKEIVLRINDSLSELEAMDYRNWNESLVDLFGKFNVLGACLYYKNVLICSHFNESEMENIEVFLRANCFKLLYENCSINEITMWQRVYPNYQSFNKENDSKKNKVFLAVVGRAELLLVTTLEENGYNYNPEVEAQSSNYLIHFIEEMNDVLDHLSIVGIENLTRIWINSAKRPQCKKLSDASEKSKSAMENSQYLKSLKEEDEDSIHELDSQLGSQKSSSGFEMTEFSDVICKDFADIIPQTITFGRDKNVLYHFTQIDLKEGKIVTVNDQNFSEKTNILSNIFKKECRKVHKMLQNTLIFDQMLKQNSKISQKSTTMMQIKEKGMIITFNVTEEEQIEFCIVGRLFQSIHGARELFVCYDSIIPQNIVEIAFRAGLNCIG